MAQRPCGWLQATDTPPTVTLLLDARAEVNQARNDNGTISLLTAAENGHAATVTLLLDARAAVNQTTTDNGATPLWMAAQNRHAPTMTLLLAARAAVTRQYLTMA